VRGPELRWIHSGPGTPHSALRTPHSSLPSSFILMNIPPRLRAYLQLMRLPNVFTALADILAGYFISAPPGGGGRSLLGLLAAAAMLYTGGIVLNDYFDYETDRRERPERPLPSGRIRRGTAGLIGFALLAFGWAAAAAAGGRSGWVAAVLAAAILSYDALTKNVPGLGAVNMGFCRFLNFALGMSLVPWDATTLQIPLITWVYVTAITALSKGEVGGGSRRPAARALVLVAAAAVWFLVLFARGVLPNAWALPALVVFAAVFLRPLAVALARPTAPHIGRAVKFMVLGLIPLDATITLAAAGWVPALLVLLLLPPAFLLARHLYVT